MSPFTVALVRHGRTLWNLERRLQGRTDLPLDSVGRGQAASAAEVLVRHDWDDLVCSPLLRARETASIVARRLGRGEPVVDDVLLERDYGMAEGLMVSDAHREWPSGEYPGAESSSALAERSASVLGDLLDAGRSTVVVGHGAFIRAGLTEVAQRPAPRILNGDVVLVGRDVDGSVRFRILAR